MQTLRVTKAIKVAVAGASGYAGGEILRLLREYEVKVCCYGHLHGASHRRALQGERGGTSFFMVSGDYLSFHPKKICD